MLLQDPFCHDLKLLIFGQIDLRLGVQIDDQQFGAVVLKYINAAFFLRDFSDT